MSIDLLARLQALASEPPEARLEALSALVGEVDVGELAGSEAGNLLAAQLVEVIDSGEGSGRDRLVLGELLGHLGDPRLSAPADEDYWVRIPSDLGGEVVVGRFPVTNAEYKAWVDAGGYDDATAWTDEGKAWLDQTDDPWPVQAARDGSAPYIVPNQPVVGVTFFEADAYARAHGARLLNNDERVWVVRGEERRPYPWGSPFGEGHANTREEVLERPCAVGLFVGDRTPEGVCDLAGNVAEWNGDVVGAVRMIHPGAWDQPSMAAWAKAKELNPPDARWAGLGFRLARDA